MEWVTDNLPLILGGIALALFVIGLALALRTQSGRDTLAAAAVKLAVFALALAERWLGSMVEPAGIGDSIRDYRQPVTSAKDELTGWLGRRS